MKDSVIIGSGNSRYLKSVADFKTLYPTYDDFAAALVAGTLPVDFNGINTAGFQQVGDVLGKNTLLKDETASLFGLGNTAVPDDVFLKLYHGMSSDVIFEADLESGATNYIIDLRDVDYSKHSLFAFFVERESDDRAVYVYPCFYRSDSTDPNPSRPSGACNTYSASRNRNNNESNWSTSKDNFINLYGKSDMFLFKFDLMSITALYLSFVSFALGFSSDPNGVQRVYGLSINNYSGQAKIKILGLNLR